MGTAKHLKLFFSKRKAQLGIIVISGWLSLALLACGQDEPARPPAQVPLTLATGNTAAPPFPAKGVTSPAATSRPRPTDDSAQVLPNTAPPLFPTSTPKPTPAGFDYTATSGVGDPQLTPTAIPTGQLAFVQAGNLWLIDDTGGNRQQLTTSNDVDANNPIVWNTTRDQVVYIGHTGELWTVDLQGKRTLIFSPGKTAKLSAAVKLPPTPTVANNQPGNTPKPATKGQTVVDAPVWSADGRYIAFTYYATDTGLLSSGEVWLADLANSKVSLTRLGEGFGPNWSNDSQTLAFLSRGEAKVGTPRPTVDSTPRGTSLLPGQQAGRVGIEAPITPGVTVTASGTAGNKTITPAFNVTANGPTPTSTPMIFYPGGTPTPTLPYVLQPTPTLYIQALPSASPTPTYPPVYLGTYIINHVMLYTTTTKKLIPFIDSDKLPEAFIDTTNTLRSYVPSPFQTIWWSPDGRFLAYSDGLSVVGVIPIAGGTPIIWTGLPQQYVVSDLQWLPRSDGAFYRVEVPNDDQNSQITLASFNNTNQAPGASGDVTNVNLLKLTQLPGQQSSCPELSPGDNYFSYYDGKTLIVTNPDGSLHASYSNATCPAWSPFGRSFASTHQTDDQAIILTTIDQSQEQTILSARGADKIFWLRSDPTTLGGPAPPPTIKP